MADLDSDVVKAQLASLDEAVLALQDVASTIAPANGAQGDLTQYIATQGLDPLGRAKLCVAVGYAIDSVLFAYLKTRNVDTDSHVIMAELDRIKAYVAKVKEAMARKARQDGKSTGAQDAQRRGVDRDAANRIIRHDLHTQAREDRERVQRVARDNLATMERLTKGAQTPTAYDASQIGKHTRFTNSPLGRDAVEQLSTTAAASSGLREHQSFNDTATGDDEDDEDDADAKPDMESIRHPSRRQASGRHTKFAEEEDSAGAQSVDSGSELGIFEESKQEKRNRQRKERNKARKTRMAEHHAKKAERDGKDRSDGQK